MSEKKGRTYSAVKNSTITLGCQFIFLIMSFICRTVFTKTLGAEYLGVSGLFSNILTILSFAELGIGTALVYRMYKPLAENDYKKLKLYVKLYKKIYTIIIIVISIVGIAIIPLLPYLVTAPNVKESITILYILYLLQTIVSYVCVYKKSILIADQKNYIVNLYTQAFNIAMNIAQCIFLVITPDFVIYCVLNIIFNLANNLACSVVADKQYPYLKGAAEGELSKEEVHGLFKDVKGLLLTKIASVAFSGTDNIFISAFIGIKYVGILSNYTLILSTLNGITNKVFDSVTASIGNLVVSKEKGKSGEVLKRLFFLNTSLYGYICVGMLVLLRTFVMDIWLSAEYDLSQVVVTLVIIELFFRSIHYPVYITRNAMGSFSEHKILFACMAVLNILGDFLLVKPLGIAGLYIATIVSRGVTYMIDIYVVYKENLKMPVWNHLKMLLSWMVFLILCSYISVFLAGLIHGNVIISFVLKVITVTIVYAAMYVIAFSRTAEFKYFMTLIGKLTNRKGKA